MIFTDQWKTVDTKLPTERFRPGVAALDKKIYVTGGHHAQPMSSSVDCYDPETNSWSQVANMNIARQGHSLVSLHGRLYAIGGAEIQVYNPDNDTWTLLQHKLDGKVSFTAACIIKKYYLHSSST